MTIRIEEVTVPARPAEIRKIKHVLCDRCGGPGGIDEEHGSYDLLEVTIELKEGTNYPGSYSPEFTRVDCCSVCFKSEVLPALMLLGFVPRKTEE